jgi:hypothetical protein
MRRDLPAEFLEAGMAAYREHLRGVYKGGDLKVLQAAADPEKFEKRKKFLENNMKELAHREAALEKNLARMAKESGQLVADHVKKEEGRRWVGQKSRSRKLGRKIGALLADAKAIKDDAVLMEVQAEQMLANVEDQHGRLDVDRENLHLQSEGLKAKAEILRREVEQERRTARLDGLKDARRMVLGANVAEPPSMTAEQLGAVFRDEVLDHVDTEVVRKLDDARRRLAGDDVSTSPAGSLEEVENRISGILKTREGNLVVSAMKTVFRLVNQKDAEPSGTTVEEISKEIAKSISRTVSEKLKDVLRRLRPDYQSPATTLVEWDNEIVAGVKAFETKARESGLEEARRALIGPDAPALENSNETALMESIQIAAEQLRNNARWEVAEALIGEKIEKVIAAGKDPVELVGIEFARLKEVEAEAKVVAANAPQTNPTTKIGQALLKLRTLIKIDGPPDAKGGYGE